MIKKILLGTFCIAQVSFIKATAFNENPVSKIRYQQEKLPKSVIIKTQKFKIRIDKQPNGKYLYQSWPAKGKITNKPSMIISDGELIPDGSGGNYYFEFHNEGYTYQVWRNYMTESPNKAPYTLIVQDQDGRTAVSQDGTVVKN